MIQDLQQIPGLPRQAMHKPLQTKVVTYLSGQMTQGM